jgi:hypothetical protein
MNKHLIEVRYIPASASKPARISLTSHWNGERVIIPFVVSLPKVICDLDAVLEYLPSKGFHVEGYGTMKRGYFIIVNEFKSLKGN